jgi:hypothetical protein
MKMKTQLDVARHRLFDAEMLNAANVKLFPGSSRDAKPEQVAEQVVKAIAQVEAGDFELIEQFDDND